MTQLDFVYEPPCKVPPKGTDNYRVLEALFQGHKLSLVNCYEICHVNALGQRVSNLRLQYGWDKAIKVDRVRTPGKKGYMAEYSIRAGYAMPVELREQERRAA